MKRHSHNIPTIPRKNIELTLPEGKHVMVSAPDTSKMKEVVIDERTSIYVRHDIDESEARYHFNNKRRECEKKAIPTLRKKGVTTNK